MRVSKKEAVMVALYPLGLGTFCEQQLSDSFIDSGVTARIAAEDRGWYEVWSNTGSPLEILRI